MFVMRNTLFRMGTAFAIALFAGACDSVGGGTMLQGNFDLGAVDGEVVEVHFTLEDSAGVVSTYEGGQMVLRCDGSYRIHLSVVQDDGGRHNLVLSSGDYVWNGATLDLVDSGGHILTASVAGSVIVVHAGGHAFEFYKLVRKPPGNAPCGS